MPLKGKTNNPAGRPSGRPNKSTAELREALQPIIEREFERLAATFDELPAERRADLLVKLLPFIMPKREHIEMQPPEPQSFVLKIGNAALPYLQDGG